MWEMLYEASHHGSLSDPEISRYLEGWGRPEDAAVVALDPADDSRVGAAWYRLMSPDNPGFGFVDASTPEVAIAVVPNSRGMGVGRVLLRGLLEMAKKQGYGALSLSVLRDNSAAVALYEKSGFVKLSGTDSEHPYQTMKVDLSVSGDT